MKVIEGEKTKRQTVEFDQRSGAPYIKKEELKSFVKYRGDEFDVEVKKHRMRTGTFLWIKVNGQRVGIKL